MSLAGFGNSSDIWVTASGVPIVKAPFSTPVKKVTPVAPTCRVVLAKVTPHSRVTGMNFGHRRDHDDRHEATDNDEEKANVI